MKHGRGADCRSSSPSKSTTTTPSWPRPSTARRAGAGDPPRLNDLGELRLEEMDEAGIDVQVISHGAPSTQRLDAEIGGAAGARRERPARTRPSQRHPDRFAGFAALPDAGPQGRGRRAGARGDQARLQGRDGPRPDQRRVPRRPALLADLRARAGARRADLPAPGGAASRRGRGVLPATTSQDFPALLTRGLGLHGRDRDPGDAAGAERRVRGVSRT